MRFSIGILTGAAVVVMSAGVAHAQVVNAYSLTTPRTGNQTNFSGSLGLEFDVLSLIQVTRLGAFDSGQNGITGTLFTVIYDRTTQLAVTPVISFSSAVPGVLDGAYRYKDIAPVYLTAGGQYQVVSWGYGTSDPNVNAGLSGGGPAPAPNSGGGSITFGRNRYNPIPGAYAILLDNNPIPRYGAGTFTFDASPDVPEPTSLALLCVGAFIGLGRIRRNRN